MLTMWGVSLPWGAVVLAAVLALVLGFLWMSVIFKYPYRKHMYGIEDVKNHPPVSAAVMISSFSTYIVVSVLTAVAYGVALGLFRAGGAAFGYDGEDLWRAFWFTMLLAVGFAFPFTVGKKVWQFKSWIVVAIDSSYELVRFTMFLLIFWFWR